MTRPPGAVPGQGHRSAPDRGTWARALGDAAAGHGVRVEFQPIVDLARGTPAGYEALARFSHPDVDVGPDGWFARAAIDGAGADLDAAVLRVALAARPRLPPDCFLTVNVEPSSLLEPVVGEALASGGSLAGVVIELTEHRTVPTERLAPVLDRLRGDGALIALDDAGSGHAGLTQMLELRPSFLKLDRALVSGIDTDEAKAAMVEMVGVFANRVDAWVLAEGIETEAELERIVALGVPLGQGYLLGRPARGWSRPSPAVVDLLLAEPDDAEPLRPLLRAAPTVRLGADDLAAGFADPAVDVVVAVDSWGRPVGVVTPISGVQGHVVSALRVAVSSTVVEVGHRLSTWGGDPSVPVVVTDRTGRFVGVLPVRRLLGALARQAESG